MRTGAVAVLDALGFKGIWRNKTRDEQSRVFERLITIRDIATRLLDGIMEDRYGVAVHAFSDSLILASYPRMEASGPSVRAVDNASCVWNVVALAAAVTRTAAGKDPVLLYRGAIAFGEFDNRDDFWMGPAVDEAAASERLAEAAVVWCCPSAAAAVDHLLVRLDDFRDRPGAAEHIKTARKPNRLLSKYPVPLKGGQIFETHVVNPTMFENDASALCERILSGFGPATDLGIAIKKQNTERLLAAASKAVG